MLRWERKIIFHFSRKEILLEKMVNNSYGYNPSGYAGGGGVTGLYRSRSIYGSYLATDVSLRGSAFRYLSADSLSAAAISSSMFYNPSSYSIKLPALSTTTTTKAFAAPGVDLGSTMASTVSLYAGLKRASSDSLYHQLGTYNSIGQTEGWYSSTNLLAKRPKYESTSQLPIYPHRPGEKDCAHYMQTRTCKFGESCKFDHPIWVPEGGIPDWKEILHLPESLPNRPGEPDCPYFLKTKRCKFGIRCKFNHPKNITATQSTPGDTDPFILPERPSEPPCAFYMKTGNCKFGNTCKFHHPKGIQVTPAREENGSVVQHRISGDVKPVQPLYTPALLHNTKGLPIRLDVEDCPFYLKTGSCKYGTTCRYNHPERNVIKSLTAAIAPTLLTSPSSHFDFGIGPSTTSLLPTFDSRLTQTVNSRLLRYDCLFIIFHQFKIFI